MNMKTGNMNYNITGNITRILPNISAAKHGRRILMSNVVHSLLLYGAPVWHGKMSKKGTTELVKVQRRIALRVACAYRTVSTDALLVVTSIPPLDLQAQVRKQKHEERRTTEPNIDPQIETNLMTSWQENWNLSSKGQWTHLLIPNIPRWYERKHGYTDNWLTQSLTGHGYFSAYFHKYKKMPSAECWFCGYPNDTAEHTIFECDAWYNKRRILSMNLGTELIPENMIPTMLASRTKWNWIAEYIHHAMKTKEKEERKRQNNPI